MVQKVGFVSLLIVHADVFFAVHADMQTRTFSVKVEAKIFF
jgi:hypothetical protein